MLTAIDGGLAREPLPLKVIVVFAGTVAVAPSLTAAATVYVLVADLVKVRVRLWLVPCESKILDGDSRRWRPRPSRRRGYPAQ